MTEAQVSTGDVGQDEQADAQTVVVGFDGSAGAMAALRWAHNEATLRGAQLRVIHAVSTFDSSPSIAVDVGDSHRHAAKLLTNAVLEVAGEDQVDGIERLIFDGSAAKVLIGAVEGDDLLVVGSRGHGGFAGSARSANSASTTLPAPLSLSLMSPRQSTGSENALRNSRP